MKRCWLHIGMHKTGSSSVQHNLSKIENPTGWRIFSVGGRPNMGPALCAMFHDEPHKNHWFSQTGHSPAEVLDKGAMWKEELKSSIMELKEENCIISAEGLSKFRTKDILALRDFLTPLFDDIRVIGYVRAPLAFKVSFFQERVKHGNKIFNIADIKPNYRGMFERFDKIFGRSNVILRKFDPATFPDRCLVADFCHQTGIQLPEGVSIRRFNESLSREACGILFAYRKFGSGYEIGKNAIKQNIRFLKPFLAMSGAKFNVCQSVFIDALEAEREDIEWMEQRLGVSLNEAEQVNGSAIANEKDLLTITRKSCEEYAERCRQMHGVELSLEMLPEGETIDPAEVAKFVESYKTTRRGLLRMKKERKMIERRLAKTPIRRLLDKTTRCFARLGQNGR